MAKKEKISLPGSGGGFFRSYEDVEKGLKLKPEHIVIASIAVVIFEIILHFYGRALF